MEIEMERIRETSRKHLNGKMQTLMHYVNSDNIKEAHWSQQKNKAVGEDKVSKEEYVKTFIAIFRIC
jgi:hypothetical protein